MKDLIKQLVSAMVDLPDEVKVSEVIGIHAHIIELEVDKSDLGKVIGKEGAHAIALRTLLMAISGKNRRRYILEIVEH